MLSRLFALSSVSLGNFFLSGCISGQWTSEAVLSQKNLFDMRQVYVVGAYLSLRGQFDMYSQIHGQLYDIVWSIFDFRFDSVLQNVLVLLDKFDRVYLTGNAMLKLQ